MSQIEFNILVFTIIIGAYLFIRTVFNLSHKETIISIIVGCLGAYIGLTFDAEKERNGK